MDDPRASSSTRTLCGVSLGSFFHRSLADSSKQQTFRKAFYVTVTGFEKLEVAKAATPAGLAIAEDPGGWSLSEVAKALPAESVHLERIRVPLFKVKQQVSYELLFYRHSEATICIFIKYQSFQNNKSCSKRFSSKPF
ncbi:hypothetical protein CR203_22440 [Salipaludibacillus neizhouensis]|uniref:Uncharacterized protein n=1 Tax=Salipaludibacillus neizhouensis TaxID=885475 RepID=A0A3A9K2E9_9BACI|nr:hypothetical protein CR203_22440 [Salipaludibacillus neizhouensis]